MPVTFEILQLAFSNYSFKQVECLAALCRVFLEFLFGGQSSSYVQTTLLVFLCCEATGGWECMFWVIFSKTIDFEGSHA